MQTLRNYQQQFLDYLSAHPFNQEPTQLYEPIDYILNLGGKRMRPVALLMSYGLYNDDVSPALPAAYAIEIFHNFTLVHDDVIDEAPLRRKQPTVHEKWNLNTSILSGDVMLVYAYDYLIQIDTKAKLPEYCGLSTKLRLKFVKDNSTMSILRGRSKLVSKRI